MKIDGIFSQESELLVLSDGRILAHNITPEMAAILSELDPENELMKQRAMGSHSPGNEKAWVAPASGGCDVVLISSPQPSFTRPQEAGATQNPKHETPTRN